MPERRLSKKDSYRECAQRRPTFVAMTVGPDVPTRRRTAESRLPLPESDRSALRTNVPAILLFGTSGLLLAVSMLHGAGSTDRMVFPLGAAALGLIVLALAGVLADRLPVPRVETIAWVGIALLGALALWATVSIDWSLSPERSWAYANRLIVYLLFLLVGIFAGATTRRAPTFAATGMTILVAATAGWALASKIAPALADDGSPVARLRAPVGYWNGLAFVLAVGVPLALWVASNQSLRRPLRAAGVALTAALLVALFLTYSRSGVLGAVVTAGVWLALAPGKRASVGALLVALAVAAAVCAVALTLPGVSEDAQSYAARREDGRIFGAVLGGALVCAFGIAWLGLRLGDRLPERLTPRVLSGRRLRIVAAVCLVGLGVAAFASGWAVRELRKFANPPTSLLSQEADRFTSLSSNNRWTWWNEAWTAFRDEPLTGTGASSFPVVHRLVREDPLTVTTPHSTPLQFLAELGLIGGLVGGAATALLLVALIRRVRRLTGSQRAAAAALLAGIVGYVLYASLDFPLDFVAVSSPVFLCAGILLAEPSGRRMSYGRARWLGLGAAIAVAGVVLVSLAAPWLAARRVERTYALLAERRPAAALAAAESAANLNPLALESTFAEARANIALGRIDRARDVLVDGVRTHPSDSTAWAELARLELAVPGREGIGADYLDRSRQLDPLGRSPATP